MDNELEYLLEIIRRVPMHRSDLTQNTALVVQYPSGVVTQDGIAGMALNIGMPIYLDQSSQEYFQADANANSNAAGNNGIRIALNQTQAAGQPVKLFLSGQINLGATLAVGETYVVSSNVGKICPLSDLGTGNFTTILGTAVNSSFLQTPSGGFYASGIARA